MVVAWELAQDVELYHLSSFGVATVRKMEDPRIAFFGELEEITPIFKVFDTPEGWACADKELAVHGDDRTIFEVAFRVSVLEAGIPTFFQPFE